MNVALLQTDVVWSNVSANIEQAQHWMEQILNADLYILPEMWATGFATQPMGIAENETHSVALEWMRQQAHAHDCAVCGSLAIQIGDGSYRNRHYFIAPEQEYFYDKHHLFSHGHEDECYTAGQQVVIVQWRGWRLLLLTCYDLRFPVWLRYGRAGHYDGMVCVANWPASRQQAWETLVRARAMENQCYMMAVNRVGADPITTYVGGSVIIDPVGRTVVQSEPDGVEKCLRADIQKERLQQMRNRFRVLDDRDIDL